MSNPECNLDSNANCNLDCVLLVSADDKLSERSFLEELFRFKNQTIQTVDQSNLNLHAFSLDNKYYNADIQFVTLKDPKELSERLAESIEVLGILFDLEQVRLRTYLKNFSS